jgi:hypothetical protein
MKLQAKGLIPIIAVLFAVTMLQSCFKDPAYPENSIEGTWRCQENSGPYGYRQYNVNVDRDTYDTARYTIFNLYNLGLNFETYTQLSDSTLTILMTNSPETSISGFGIVHPKFKGIRWEFNVGSAGFVEAEFYRP